MKLNTETRDISRIGGGRETGFKIAANAQAFDILSSKLYTDTKLAIVRELSTNALDAQKEAGNADKPFDVHLPNSMSPTFSIRDYGTGLSQEDLETIYTTYFQSTRSDSNDYTGALGLGSKSPFAYTDMFMVTTYFNGSKSTYSAFKNESGQPSIKLMQESVTDEPNGIEISIEVKFGDENAFFLAARKVYSFFDVRPNITGQRFKIEDCTPMVEGDGYRLFDKMPYDLTRKTAIYITMGNVLYAAGEKITHNIGFYGVLILEAQIGDCTVAASREELQYNEETIHNVQKLVDSAEIDITKKIEEQQVNASSALERAIGFKSYTDIFQVAKSKVAFPLEANKKWSLRKATLSKGKLFITARSGHGTIAPHKGSVYHFVENDLEKMKQSDKSKLRHWTSQLENKHGVYLCSIEDAVRFQETFGEPIVKLSELPDAPRVKSAPGTVGTGDRTYIKALTYSGYGGMSSFWLDTEKDKIDTTKAIAVRRSGYKVIWNGAKVSPSYLMEAATRLGYTTVYGVADRYFDRITKALGLENLEDKAKAYAIAEVAKMDKYAVARHNGRYHTESSAVLLKAIKGLSTECDDLIAFTNTPLASKTLSALCSDFGIKLPKSIDFKEVFNKRYPLLTNVNVSYANPADIIEYITLKEKN